MNEIPKPPPDQPKAPDGKPPGTPPTADGAGKGQADHADTSRAAEAQRAKATETAKFRDAYLASQKAGSAADHAASTQGHAATRSDHVGQADAPRRPASADHLAKQPEQAGPRSDQPVQAGKQDHPERQYAEALRGALKADDPQLRKDATNLAENLARDAFDPLTGGTKVPESLARQWKMTPEQAGAVVRVLEREGFKPQVEPIVYDGSGRLGTEENVSRREMRDRVGELHQDTTIGGIYAAWRGARGGSAEEMHKAGQDGNVSEGLMSIGGGRMRADADRNIARVGEEAEPVTTRQAEQFREAYRASQTPAGEVTVRVPEVTGPGDRRVRADGSWQTVQVRPGELTGLRTGADHPDNPRVADPKQPETARQAEQFREAYRASQKPVSEATQKPAEEANAHREGITPKEPLSDTPKPASPELPPGASSWGRGNEMQGRGAEEALRNVLPGEKFYKNFPNFDRAVYTPAGPHVPAAEIGQLKTIDTTLKTYQGRGFYRAIVNAAGELAGPGESTWAHGKQEVTIGAGTRRVLDLALPMTPLTPTQEDMLQQAKDAAATMDVRVDVYRLR